MNKKQMLKYLKETELDVQSANAALFITDLVYNAYLHSDVVHKVRFTPMFCYISYNKMSSFYQFFSKAMIGKVAKKMYIGYKKTPGSLEKRISEHNTLTRKLDRI